MERLLVKPDHLRLLSSAYVGWDDCEFGAPAINCKRPYGNSNVVEDMARILGFPIDEEGDVSPDDTAELIELHRQTEEVLQIILTAQSFDVLGEYTREAAWHPWHKS